MESSSPSSGRQKKRRRRPSRGGTDGPRGLPGKVAEAAVVLTVFVAPLLLGSVHLWSAAIELAGVAVAAVALLLGLRGGSLTLPRWPILGLGLLLLLEALQLVPLPPFAISILSPQAAETLAYTVGDLGGWPAWHPLSLDPRQTALEVARHATWLTLFVVTVELALSRHRRRRLAGALGLLAAVLVLLAFGQKLARFDLIYGFFPVKPGGFLFASFVNPNHFAALLGLLAPVALGLAFGARERARAVLWGVVFVLTGITAVLTLSRGGMLGFAVGLAVFALLLFRLRVSESPARASNEAPGLPPGRARWLAGAGILAVIAVLSGVAYVALDPVLAELETFTGEDAITGEMRLKFWGDAVGMVQDHWFTGIGRGAWAVTFPIYRTLARAGTVVYAESQPIQALAELGLIGGGFFIALFAWLAIRSALRVATPRGAGLVAGLVALGIHELADFSTVFGGVAIPATVALAVACLGRRRGGAATEGATDRDQLELPLRPAAAAVLGLLALGGGTLLHATGRLADDEVAWLQEEGLETGAFLARAREVQLRHPTDHMPALVAARVLSDRGEAEVAMRWASRAMYLNPTEPRPHLIAADLLARAGQRAQALLEYRLAARWGHPAWAVLSAAERFFPAATDLELAVPEDASSRMQLGRYLQRRRRFEDQLEVATRALQTWPEDPELLALAATAARVNRDFERALEYARTSSRIAPQDPRGPLELSRALRATGAPAEAIEVLRTALQRIPGQPALSFELSRFLLREGDANGAGEILDRASGLRGSGQRAVFHQIRGEILARQGQPEQALSAFRLAARINDRNPRPLTAAGDLLRSLGRDAEAIESYRAALERAPEGPQRQAIQRRLEALGVL